MAAAIEILTEILQRHRPASESLKDWGKSHRFAGSGDRHAIGTLVYDCLRKKQSAAAAMQDDTPRGIVLGTLKTVWAIPSDHILEAAHDKHGPGELTTAEITCYQNSASYPVLNGAKDYPVWIEPQLRQVFGDRMTDEMAALSERAPIDLRVNSLKASRDQVISALARFNAVPGPLVDSCVRIAAPGPDEKHVNVEAEPAHGMGWFEIQDAASQLVSQLSGARPGQSVADICAGAGGKTLALAALMENQGRLVAHDRDRHRLRPIFERISRSGATIIDVIAAPDGLRLDDLGPFDCVVIDAPCTGSGAWRRKPESKWKLTPKILEQRNKDQMDVLTRGSKLVKSGGILVYITCSILPQENLDQITSFMKMTDDFKLVPYADQWRRVLKSNPVRSADGKDGGLLLTPLGHQCDGFFIAIMQRN